MYVSLHIRFYFIVCTIITSAFILSENRSFYVPIVLVSGLDSDAIDMKPMVKLIKKYLPGAYVKNVQIGLGKITSFWNTHDQGQWLAYELYDDHNLRNGCNIIAHSQGGLTARYFIQRFNYPRVHNYIALGVPQRGVCRLPYNLDKKYMWLKFFEKYLSDILYLSLFQQCVSFADYWNDSVRYDDYLHRCSFLPYLNNEKSHDFFNLFKENINKLQNMVLVKSVQENVIEPAESCHFGFYKKGSKHEIEDLFASEIYAQDWLGLRQLYESGRLHFKEAQCAHNQFDSNEQNFVVNVLPFLILEPTRTSVELDNALAPLVIAREKNIQP